MTVFFNIGHRYLGHGLPPMVTYAAGDHFAIVGRNLALILKGSQMVAGGLTARSHPRSRSHAMFSIPEVIADNIRGCRFAQPPATFYNPYRGNVAMIHDNEVVDLLNHA